MRSKPFVVALMQPDRRLIENVHDADEPGADLAGQPNALCFTAGQRVGAAIEGQVVQTDVDQKLQPGADLLEDLLGDGAAPAFELQAFEVGERLLSPSRR